MRSDRMGAMGSACVQWDAHGRDAVIPRDELGRQRRLRPILSLSQVAYRDLALLLSSPDSFDGRRHASNPVRVPLLGTIATKVGSPREPGALAGSACNTAGLLLNRQGPLPDLVVTQAV
jgi:hypothetical protein